MSAPTTPSKKVQYKDGDHRLLDAIRMEDNHNNKLMNQSYGDLLDTIDKNISSASLNIENGEDEDTEGNSTYNISEDYPPLNLAKSHSDINTSNLLAESSLHDEDDILMEDIPRVPSFNELEYNTHLNRTSSLSKVSGPRKFSNPTMTRTLSLKKISSTSLQHDSPSKKSVVFESSPPKVLEYDQLTPEHSDDSFYNDDEADQLADEPFNSNWSPKQRKDLAKLIPPSPPKHIFRSPSPQKDTSMNSSDGDNSLNLTREDIGSLSMTVEERLDLFLDNDELSQRHYDDELNRSSHSSPAKSITKEEQSFLLKIRSKKEVQEEKALYIASDLFEEDIRNNDKDSDNHLQLAPSLKKKGSNNSLRDEERVLKTVNLSHAGELGDVLGDNSNDSIIIRRKADATEKNSSEQEVSSEDITPESPLKSSYQSPAQKHDEDQEDHEEEEALASSTQPLEESSDFSNQEISHQGNFLETSMDSNVGKSFVDEIKEDYLFNSSPDNSVLSAKKDILPELNQLEIDNESRTAEIASTPIKSIEIPTSLDPVVFTQSVNAFDTDLFTDKQSGLGLIQKKKSIDFISIWHDKPLQAPAQVQPQYSVKAKKQEPPKRIMKLIKSFHDSEHGTGTATEEEDDMDLSFGELSDLSIGNISTSSKTYTKEDLKRRSSLVMKSASRSSVINLTKRNSLLFQHPVLDADDSYGDDQSSVIHRVFTSNDNDVELPNISGSSDFAGAFSEWEVKDEQQVESPTKMPKSVQRDLEKYRDIWSTSSRNNQPSSQLEKQASTVRHEKLKQIVNHTAFNYNEDIAMKDNSTQFQQEPEVNDIEDYGVDISFDSNSIFDAAVSRKASQDLTNVRLTNIKETPLKRFSIDYSQLQKSKQQQQQQQDSNSDGQTALGPPIKMRAVSTRIMSTNSFATGFNLDEDFEKTLKDDVKYVPVEYQKPAIERERLQLQQQQQQQKETATRQPLAPIVNQPITPPQSKKLDTECAITQSLAELKMEKKRRTTSNNPTTAATNPIDLPEFSDSGRLYIHINSLEDIALDNVPEHKAKFSLSLDNCTHVTETPLMDLQSSKSNKIDKEFEIVLQKDITELYFNLKVKYTRNENELVEKLERVPVKQTGKLSQMFGMRPKYRLERRYVTQKRTRDNWDDAFSQNGCFGKNKIEFNTQENAITGKKDTYIVELFNDWRKEKNGNIMPMSLVGKLNVTMLYIPRVSKHETLPPSISIAESVAQHWLEQSLITHEGYLHQEGGDCLIWKRRFFKLRGTELIGLNEELKPRLKINLSNVKFIFYKGKKFKSNSRILTDEFLINDSFKLVFYNDEILNFKADLRSNQLKWIETLEKVVELNKLNQPWVKLVSEKLN